MRSGSVDSVNAPCLIVGLGNPGSEYARTRHNAGFMVADELARGWRADWRDEPRFGALVARAGAGASLKTVWLAKPQTFMNASGEAVGALVRYYRVPIPQVLVLVDDVDLPLGTVRMRSEGSSGGHHGLDSIERHLGTRGYARLRLGIGRVDPGLREVTGHVLGRFAEDEVGDFARVTRHAVAQVVCWLDEGIEKAMARYNGSAK